MKTKNKKTTILLDFDGTIADTFASFIIIAKKMLPAVYIKNISEDDIDKYRNLTIIEIIKKMNFPIYKIPFFSYKFREFMRDHIDRVKLFDGIQETLEILADNFVLGILSSNSEDNIRIFLKKYNLEKYFKIIQCGVSLFGKSHVINKTIKNNSLEKKEVIYIGDEVRDIESAKKSDIDVISVSWGFNKKDVLKRKKPNFIVDNPSEIIDILI